MRLWCIQLKNALGVVVAAVLTGCALPIAHERALTPVFYGTVLDAETSAPVEAVRIEVTDTTGFGRGSAVGYSDAAGKYKVGVVEQASWYFVIAPLPGWGICFGEAVFTHPKYETHSEAQRFYRGIEDEPNCFPVIRVVRLQPKTPSPATAGDRPQAGGASAQP
jgi:hypothetical protein